MAGTTRCSGSTDEGEIHTINLNTSFIAVIRKSRKKRRSTAKGPRELCRVCKEITKGKSK